MRLDMIGLVVADIQKSLDFYEKLGIPTPKNWDGPYAEATLESGIRISWNSIEMIREMDKQYEPPAGHRSGMAFLCDSVTDVDARYWRLVDGGYESKTAPWDAFWGQRYAQVIDPDGNIVDLFHELPTLEGMES